MRIARESSSDRLTASPIVMPAFLMPEIAAGFAVEYTIRLLTAERSGHMYRKSEQKQIVRKLR